MRQPWDTRRIAISYLYTGVFCSAVVLLLQGLGVGGSWAQSAIVSFSIGFCIHTAFIVLTAPFCRWIGARLAPLPITAIGLGTGLALGGWLGIGNPAFFFQAEGYGSLLLGVFFGILGFIFFTTRDDLMEARASLAEQERQRVETELRLLQAQIEPHFLFNTLSNVISLIRTDPDRAESTLVNLTQFLRSTLKRSRETTAALADELNIIRAYLQIQQTRMGERLSFTIDADTSLQQAAFPPLLLQPLVENAVIHGIEPSEAGGTIHVHAEAANGVLTVTVSDDGMGIQSNTSSSRVGLRNILERLHSLFGDAASLSLSERSPHGVKAELVIPMGTS